MDSAVVPGRLPDAIVRRHTQLTLDRVYRLADAARAAVRRLQDEGNADGLRAVLVAAGEEPTE